MATAGLPRLRDAPSRMEEIDRLGWAAGICFTCHGARIGIRVNDPTVLDRLPPHLPPGWQLADPPVVDHLYSLLVRRGGPGRRAPGDYLLYSGADQLARAVELEHLFPALESDLHSSVALAARRRLFVHAGVVGWRGRAVVIPGRSMTGKTTLVEAFVRAGSTYYSDEYAVLDARGRVHPYAKPLNLRQRNGAPPRQCPAEDLGGVTGTRPLPVGLIVAARYAEGARWRPRVLSPGEALLALLDNTVLARIRPGFALATLQRVVPAATALKGRRGEAAEFVELLLEHLETEPPPPAGPAGGGLRRNGSGGSGRTTLPTVGRKRGVPQGRGAST